MHINFVKEEMPYSFDTLEQYLGEDEENSRIILNSLISMNVLKKVSKSSSEEELEDLFDIESLRDIQDRVERKPYVFKYVGILMVKNACFFIYPKYIKSIQEDRDNGLKKFKQILSVIRKYQSRQQDQKLMGREEKRDFNLLSYTLEMISDYYDNGLYSNDKQIIEENGLGEILWEKTILEQNAYIFDEVPIYLNLFTSNSVINENNLFRRLHRCILTQCSRETSDILDVLGISPVIISDENLADFGNVDYLEQQLKQELTNQFVTQKQHVLNELLLYIKRDEIQSSQEKISYFGTSSFNLVWQDVCEIIKHNCLKKSLGEMNLTYKGCDSETMIKNIISKPIWEHLKSQNKHEAKKGLELDIVEISNGNLMIYDAKYYNLILNEKRVSKQPHLEDITKQYLYELALMDFAEENQLTLVRNAFLMPYDGLGEHLIGKVSYDIFKKFNELSFHDIDVILESCEEAYKMYLREK